MASVELAPAANSPSPTPAVPHQNNQATSMVSTPDDPALSFLDAIRLPLDDPVLLTPLRTRVTRTPADDEWVPRRSTRLAAKSAFRDPVPERQAKRVLIAKWDADAARTPPVTDN